MDPTERLLRACRGEPVDRPPVWLMRQAGRYLPEYRRVREELSFLELCSDVDRAVEVSLQPLRRVGTEAVILFSDIFVPLLGAGVDVEFSPGPTLAQPIRTRGQVEALRPPDVEGSVPFVFEIVRRLREELGDARIPLIGFSGAPFTLAAYLVEGGGSRNFGELKRLMFHEPEILRALQAWLVELVVQYLNAQIEAGAQVVQLFDTWAGILSIDDYREWVLPVHREIAAKIDRERAPLVLYVGNGAHVLDAGIESGADVLSLDWRVDLAEAARRSGGRVSLQGNLDPATLSAPRDEIFARVRALSEAAAPARGHVLNLGHGCLPDTPVEGVRAFTDAARALGDREQPVSRDVFTLDLTHVEELLPRYTTDAPRYTSYPTAPVWKEDYGSDAFRADLGDAAAAGAPLSLYVHIPFCESLCHFCACNRIITRDHSRALRYLDVIEREIEAVRESAAEPGAATQLHWGGGTPTYLHPEQIIRLHAALTAAFPLAAGAEVSIEVDPRVTTPEHVRALRECGFNRVSMGVQDFDARVQEAIHRIQPVDQTAALVECARREGFASVNFDLIYGLPFQTEASFADTLDRVCEMRPDRVALYSYAHVTWLAKQQRGFERTDLPDPVTRMRIMLASIRRFLDEGYVFIGLDHFALPEDELARSLSDRTLRRNFMGHTTQAETQLIGFGPSAISELRSSYAQSQRDLAGWQSAVEADGLATLRGHALSREDVERRWIISRIVCHGELHADEFEAEFGHALAPAYAKELESLDPALADGLLLRSPDGSFEVTPLGRLLVRNLATAFDAYLPEQRRAGQRIFSKTV